MSDLLFVVRFRWSPKQRKALGLAPDDYGPAAFHGFRPDDDIQAQTCGSDTWPGHSADPACACHMDEGDARDTYVSYETNSRYAADIISVSYHEDKYLGINEVVVPSQKDPPPNDGLMNPGAAQDEAIDRIVADAAKSTVKA